jgi:hypothetical protein
MINGVDSVLEVPENRLRLNTHLKDMIKSIHVYSQKVDGSSFNKLYIKFANVELGHMIFFLGYDAWHSQKDNMNYILDLMGNEEITALFNLQALDLQDTGEKDVNGLPVYKIVSAALDRDKSLDLFWD